MRTGTRSWVMAALLTATVCCVAAPAASQEIALFPVYDRSTEPYGDAFSRYLTSMLFETLESDGWRVALVNPGALYSPMRESWKTGRAAASGLKAVVLPVLDKARRKAEKDDHPRLVVGVEIVDAASGATGERIEGEKEVKRRDLEAGFDAGSWSIGREFWTGLPITVYAPSRKISKQPLGKAVIALAEALGPRLAAGLQAVGVPRRGLQPPGASCGVEFAVRYVGQNAASRSYIVLVNGLEESARVINGKLALPNASGRLVFEVSVRDAPFRLPVQPIYFANTVLDCARPERALTLQIGPAGEAWLAWQ